MERQYRIPTPDLVQIARGFLMGGADVIPGVSGGTVALVLGIYTRLVTAVSRCDRRLLQFVKRGEWKAAAEYIDLHFLGWLAVGLALGIGGLATLMNYLLVHQQKYTFAVFTGLILGSSVLVARVVGRWSLLRVGLFVAGTVVAFVVVGLPFLESPPESQLYIFFCGTVGICAMILPGISGAFILLILGKYTEITGLIKEVLHLRITHHTLVTIAVFSLGMATGLILFSKLLRWLLSRYEAGTMAVLCGFMLGSLRKLWPFKIDLTPEELDFKRKVFANVFPPPVDHHFWICLVLGLLAFASVLLLNHLTDGHRRQLTNHSDG